MDAALDRACDPKRTDRERGAGMTRFVNFVNKEQDGPQIAIKLLIAKYQSSTEGVVLSALEVTESCVRSCGKRFHDEIGKFRYLNELIKLVSPKYSADRTPPAAKKKIKTLLYNWSEGLNHHPKMREAFMMLKNQGLVHDEDLPKREESAPHERIGPAVFEDENRSALLKRLLASKHPEDLEAANRLIKDMVKKDNLQMTNLSKRIAELETCQNNIKLLTEMLAHYEPGQNHEIITELYKSCVEMRTKLQKMATEVDEGGDQMTEIFQLSDELTKVLELHDRKIAGQATPASSAGQQTLAQAAVPEAAAGGDDFDLLGGIGAPAPASQAMAAASTSGGGLGDLDTLLSLDPLGDSSPAMATASDGAVHGGGSASLLDDLAMLDIGGSAAPPAAGAGLGGLNGGLLGMGAPAPATGLGMDMLQATPTQQQTTAGMQPAQPQALGAQPAAASPAAGGTGDLFVPIDSIQMSSKPPLVAFDKNGLRMLVFITQNVPQPNVQTYVVQTMNTSMAAITNFSFQAAVPKSQRVKLQPASGESLPAHNNPLSAPPTINQVMLIANPAQEPLRLRFKLDFVANGSPFSDVGQVEG
ncbi:ADP-ribosylation factor-binding protein GGA1-like [Sycon ciliatum]|uniref:ADP-ribosylation factor-binding protein GGA1-like n=1 Tax=Sycon ciliatum TaxID=27933 RepID=UPI0031F6C833|eukprot:scpid40661/ scgid29931/ ADP-ribosylation factor-binding protein GGA1; Gamma-adaptin-related protein 1; Golgi-localized, gamma ear-containing, ARF-binding protein 1